MLAIIPSARALAPDRPAQQCACFPLAPRPRPVPSSASFPAPAAPLACPRLPRPNRAAPFSAINFGFCALRNYFRPAPKNLQPTDSKNPLISVPNLAHTGKYSEVHPFEIGLRFPIPPLTLQFPFSFPRWRRDACTPDSLIAPGSENARDRSSRAGPLSLSLSPVPRDLRSCPPKK